MNTRIEICTKEDESTTVKRRYFRAVGGANIDGSAV